MDHNRIPDVPADESPKVIRTQSFNFDSTDWTSSLVNQHPNKLLQFYLKTDIPLHLQQTRSLTVAARHLCSRSPVPSNQASNSWNTNSRHSFNAIDIPACYDLSPDYKNGLKPLAELTLSGQSSLTCLTTASEPAIPSHFRQDHSNELRLAAGSRLTDGSSLAFIHALPFSLQPNKKFELINNVPGMPSSSESVASDISQSDRQNSTARSNGAESIAQQSIDVNRIGQSTATIRPTACNPSPRSTIHCSKEREGSAKSDSVISNSSSTTDICRICHCEAALDAPLVAPCYCCGSSKYVHQKCLQQWIKSSQTKTCEVCRFAFIMQTKVKPFRKWEKLDISVVERRKILCSICFHIVAITCVVWSLYVLIDRTTEEIRENSLDWPFWTKLVVIAIGFTGGIVFMYVQCKMYVELFVRWRAFNKVIYIRNGPGVQTPEAAGASTIEGARNRIHQINKKNGKSVFQKLSRKATATIQIKA